MFLFLMSLLFKMIFSIMIHYAYFVHVRMYKIIIIKYKCNASDDHTIQMELEQFIFR